MANRRVKTRQIAVYSLSYFMMNAINNSVIFGLLLLAVCGKSHATELKNWTDPITGEESLFQAQEIGPWMLYALDEYPEGFMLIENSGDLLLSYDEMRQFGAVSIFSKPAKKSSLIHAYDTNGDGVFDKVELVSTNSSLEVNLIDARWVLTPVEEPEEDTEE